MTKKKNPFIMNKHEILWNLVNAAIAGILVFLGALTTGEITSTGICAAIVASFIVIMTKFRDYWTSEKNEYSVKSKIFSFA